MCLQSQSHSSEFSFWTIQLPTFKLKLKLFVKLIKLEGKELLLIFNKSKPLHMFVHSFPYNFNTNFKLEPSPILETNHDFKIIFIINILRQLFNQREWKWPDIPMRVNQIQFIICNDKSYFLISIRLRFVMNTFRLV